MKTLQITLLVLLTPLFLLYFVLCILSPLLRFGAVRRGKGVIIHIVGDLIHSDYLFSSDAFHEFKGEGKHLKVGWGDRRIFLETRIWGNLKSDDFIRAFFGLNPTVLRIEFLDQIPEGAKKIEMSPDQLEILKGHVRESFHGEPIKRRPEDYQGGTFYESRLTYNCITNCNNWVNRGMRRAGLTNRIWSPLSFWL